jgi:hypothetical protein
MKDAEIPLTTLPVTRNLRWVTIFSLVVALLMTVAAAAGLLYPDRIYPTEELQQSFVANDVVNLLIILPTLLGSIWFARRGKLLGLLFWPGALFVVFYNAIAYTFGLPLGVGFLLALAQATLSAYTTAGLVASIDGDAVRQRLSDSVPVRVTGGALAGAGLLFLVLAGSTMVNAVTGGAPIAEHELGVQVADLFIIPALVVGGVQLWRRQPLGYVTGAGLLFQASMLFIGLLAFFILQPVLTAAPFALTDTIVIALMSLIILIPFGLFLRGVVSRREQS